MDTFTLQINRILGHEGGYVNDPQDPGGETNWGISKRSYPHVNIKALTRDEAIAIYRRDFYMAAGLDKLRPAVAYQMLDGAVNSGPENAARWLQRAAGVAADGRIGPITRAAVQAADLNDMVMIFLAERLEFMSGLRNWPAHGKGWARRIAANLRFAALDN